jgi:site-specific recombinase XerD
MASDHSFYGVSRSVDPSLISLSSVIDDFLLSCKLENKSETTTHTYSERLNDFLNFLRQAGCDLAISRITRIHVRQFLAYLKDKVTPRGTRVQPSTVNAYYRCLHRFFKWCIQELYIKPECFPMLNMQPPKFPRSKPKPFSKQDWENLLLLCEGNSFIKIRNKALILLAFDTGLRLAELAGIRVNDLNLETGLIRVIGKGSKERVVRIGLVARRALARYMRFRDNSYPELWQSEERRPMTRDGIQTTIKRLCRSAGVEDARPSPHTFRHSCAFASLANGANIYDLKELFGHSNIQTTQIYLDAYNSMMAAQKHASFSPVDHLNI